MARDEIDTALNENPPFPDPTALQLGRELQTPRRMMPEQIVGDEDLIANAREITAHHIDGALAHRARVQLPDRTERTSKRTSTSRLEQPNGPMCKAGILFPPSIYMMARRHRHVVEHEGAALSC